MLLIVVVDLYWLDKIRKNIIALFKNVGLWIIIETNPFETDFLNVTVNLVMEKVFLLRKPNNQPLYINKKPNHPPTILIQKTKDCQIYLAMKTSKKNQNLHEMKVAIKQQWNIPKQQCKQQKESSHYYMVQSPYSQNVKTNIKKTFLKLVKRHFLGDHKLYKIFTRNTLNLSYSCMGSISSVTKQHNYKVLSTTENVDQLCKFRNKKIVVLMVSV